MKSRMLTLENTVLNPLLYKKLRTLFGEVRVANEGMSFAGQGVRVAGKMRIDIAADGEYYRVNCPFCGDRRFRLWIHHMWDQEDDFGRRMRFLAICYNETACLRDAANRSELYESLSRGIAIVRSDIREGSRTREDVERNIRWPGQVVTVDKLPATHKAVAYLVDRKLDVEELGRVYRVAYCFASVDFPAARERLIIPIYRDGQLMGWQARYVGEIDWKRHRVAKYYNHPDMAKSQILGNWDIARKYHTGVIVEGPIDALNFGGPAMFICGNHMSDTQIKLFAGAFGDRAGVILLDPTEYDAGNSQDLVDKLRDKFSRNIVAVRLPDGTDPGSLDRVVVRKFVKDVAKDHNIKISFSRIKD